MNNEEYRKNVEKKIAEIKKERGEVKYEFTNPVLEKGLKLVAYLDGKISLEEYRDPSFKYQDENNIKKTNAKQKQGFIKKLKHKIKMKQEEMRDLQLNIQIGNRQRDLCFIYSILSKEFVHNFNVSMIVESAGWIGGDYTAADIKKRCVQFMGEYFTNEEKCVLLKDIEIMRGFDNAYANNEINLDEYSTRYKQLIASKQLFADHDKVKVKR